MVPFFRKWIKSCAVSAKVWLQTGGYNTVSWLVRFHEREKKCFGFGGDRQVLSQLNRSQIRMPYPSEKKPKPEKFNRFQSSTMSKICQNESYFMTHTVWCIRRYGWRILGTQEWILMDWICIFCSYFLTQFDYEWKMLISKLFAVVIAILKDKR